MRKIACLVLGHRMRVVQHFGPFSRRIKCMRCGADWGMNDSVRAIIDWSPKLQQLYRDLGYEILEPMPILPPHTTLDLLGTLTWREILGALRWPSAFALIVGTSSGVILHGAGLGQPHRAIAIFAITFAIMSLLARPAYRRAFQRKRNTLEA